MAGTAVFTSATYTYFSRARTLAGSVKQFHPDWHVCFLLSDEPPPGVEVDWGSEPFDSVMRLADLQLDDKPWLFRHNVIELCTAVKGFAMMRLQDQGFDKVFYLDPDTVLFAPLQPLWLDLDQHSILLTPHQIRPESTPQAVIDNEWTALKYGVYNLGFAGVRSDAQGRGFAQWWAARCHEYCRDDVPNGLFTDQRWCDLVPALFDRVKVIRDPGYNVASWNLSHRSIRARLDGNFDVSGVPLRFFHFSKVDHIGETMLRRYAGRNLDVIELMYWYRRQLAQNSLPGVPDRYWAYGTYDDGQAISATERRSYAVLPDARTRFPDPFISGPGSYREWFEQSGSNLRKETAT